MTFQKWSQSIVLTTLVLTLVGCGVGGSSGGVRTAPRAEPERDRLGREIRDGKVVDSTIWDLFAKNSDPSTTVAVNKYLWKASLEVLNFMPIRTVDPFTGVIVMGYGTPPGGKRAYRATVYVQDPALDARSLKVALQGRNGPVSADTVRAVEDAILSRARQLRIQDSKL